MNLYHLTEDDLLWNITIPDEGSDWIADLLEDPYDFILNRAEQADDDTKEEGE